MDGITLNGSSYTAGYQKMGKHAYEIVILLKEI